MRWLNGKPEWVGATPRDVLVRHLESQDPYVVLDLVQEYVNGLVLRKSSKRKAYSVIRSYFDHNRSGLPRDSRFKIRGDRPPVEAKLSVDDIRDAYHAASLRYRSILILKWQSFLDNERIVWMNRFCSDAIVRQMQMGECPIRIDIPGRKSGENDAEGRFYTYIGKDAVDTLTQYFEEER